MSGETLLILFCLRRIIHALTSIICITMKYLDVSVGVINTRKISETREAGKFTVKLAADIINVPSKELTDVLQPCAALVIMRASEGEK